MTPTDIPISEYAFIGDGRTGALVSRAGSVDWFCVPDFDSPAIFAAVLGEEENGRWLLRPADSSVTSTRRYLDGSLVLETTHTTATGIARVVDLMPSGTDRADILRRVEGVEGSVDFVHELRVRPWYGARHPFSHDLDEGDSPALVALAGPDSITLRGPHLPKPDETHTSFTVQAGETYEFDLTWHPSHEPACPAVEFEGALRHTVQEARDWLANSTYDGPYRDAVDTSLLVLRALSHRDLGGMVAAPTASLPEDFGGERNWDYRYCWLRDSALMIEALVVAGFSDKAGKWRDWLLRAVAGDPTKMQIMYRIDGGHDLPERELNHLRGYADSRPVRIGNGAVGQRQTDVPGEVLVALEHARRGGLTETKESADLQLAIVRDLVTHWREPDHGIWEIRGPERYFTHSRVMVWAALDRAVRAVEEGAFPDTGEVADWRSVRDAVRAEIDERGVDSERGCFVQHYDTDEVDASLLLLPVVGFCEPDDPRFVATVEAIEHDLLRDGLVLRYRTESGVDGLDGDEHPFVLCCAGLVSAYVLMGRRADAEDLMKRTLDLASDLGLLAEEAEGDGTLIGNFPQAFSHLGVVRAAIDLAGD